MQIELTAELEAFVQQLIADGLYGSPSEAVHDALCLLKDQADLRRLKLAELKKLIAVGVEQAERGQTAPLDMAAIKARAAERLQMGQDQEATECPR
jgi:putative addiction module CopG family antidote